MDGQWEGFSQGREEEEGWAEDKQMGRERARTSGCESGAQDPDVKSAAAAAAAAGELVRGVESVGRLGRATHAEHVPPVQRRCGWHFFLLSQRAPGAPGWDKGCAVQRAFLQSSDGPQSSAARQRWPGQPKTQALEEGMYGFSGREVRRVRAVEGAGRKVVQL